MGIALLLIAALSAESGYRCNTHTHTSAPPQSDANATPEVVAEWYRSHGYQCIVITDHEYLTDVESLNKAYDGKFLVLRGQEITQTIADPAYAGGVRHLHVNAIDIKADKPIKPLGFPQPSRGVDPAEIYRRNIEAIHAAGGIAQVNHPNLQWSVKPENLLPLTDSYLLEIWNAFPTSNNLGGVSNDGTVGVSTEELWDTLLSAGKVVWGVASDDTHEYHSPDNREAPTPGKGWIVVQATALTAPAVTDAMRKGRFYASTGISLDHYSADAEGLSIRMAPIREWSPALKSSTRYTTRFIGESGRVLAQVTGDAPRYRFKGSERYVRASIVDSDGRRAWTQPLYREAPTVAALLSIQPEVLTTR